ncbi:MAG TPA: hypothetical protein VF209_00845 [Patescibacteria group bacterium]
MTFKEAHIIDQKKHSGDVLKNITPANFANLLLFRLQTLINQPFNKEGSFLALGAGSAQCELTLASLMGYISNKQVMLVDRNFSDYLKTELETKAILIEQGIFTFLTGVKEDKGAKESVNPFGFITAIGVEYLFSNQETVELLLELLSYQTVPGGILIVNTKGTITLNNYSGWNRLNKDLEVRNSKLPTFDYFKFG